MRQEHNCSLFLREFLDFIETKMLVVNETERAKSAMVRVELKTMLDRCRRDPDYTSSLAQSHYARLGTIEERSSLSYWRQIKSFFCC